MPAVVVVVAAGKPVRSSQLPVLWLLNAISMIVGGSGVAHAPTSATNFGRTPASSNWFDEVGYINCG